MNDLWRIQEIMYNKEYSKVCSSCLTDSLMGLFEKDVIKCNPRESFHIEKVYQKIILRDKQVKCVVCGRRIAKQETTFDMNEIELQVLSQIGKMLSNKICCCSECDIGELYNSYRWSRYKMCEDDEEREEAERELSQLDTSETIEDLFWNYFEDDKWIDYTPSIFSKVSCPNCGKGSGENYDDKIDYGTLDKYSEVYTKSDVKKFNALFYGDQEDSLKNLLENIANKFEYDEIREITQDYLDGRNNSSLIFSMEEYIKTLFDDKFGYLLNKGRVVYRARSMRSSKKYSKDNMWEPPSNVATQGRYNEKGISVLYCSNSINVIKCEVHNEGYGYAIGKFLVKEGRFLFPIDRVFSEKYAEYIIAEDNKENIEVKKSYLLTNLVSAICRNCGYDGIVYLSVKNPRFVNYALFCNYTRGREIDCIDVIKEK